MFGEDVFSSTGSQWMSLYAQFFGVLGWPTFRDRVVARALLRFGCASSTVVSKRPFTHTVQVQEIEIPDSRRVDQAFHHLVDCIS